MNWVDVAVSSVCAVFCTATLTQVLFPAGQFARARARLPWPFTQIWLSMCSRHMQYDSKCPICNAGHWHNVVKLSFMSKLHDRHYMIWIRMVNWRLWLFKPKEWKEFIASRDPV
jgi:hypothetical protein